MSSFERGGYQWRETYFVLFDSARKPTLTSVQQTLQDLSPRFQLVNPSADDQGLFESLTVVAPDENAALDVSFLSGEDVLSERAKLIDEIRATTEREVLAQLLRCDARLDVMHFQDLAGADPDEDADEMFDPSALLMILEALVTLTDGVGVDPQSGSLL